MVDIMVMGEHFPYFPVNNTYGIEAYDRSYADYAMGNWTMAGGCRDMIEECRAAMPNGYHGQDGTDETVTELCGSAFAFCGPYVYFTYDYYSPVCCSVQITAISFFLFFRFGADGENVT